MILFKNNGLSSNESIFSLKLNNTSFSVFVAVLVLLCKRYTKGKKGKKGRNKRKKKGRKRRKKKEETKRKRIHRKILLHKFCKCVTNHLFGVTTFSYSSSFS